MTMKRAKRMSMSLGQGKAKDYYLSMHEFILIALLNSTIQGKRNCDDDFVKKRSDVRGSICQQRYRHGTMMRKSDKYLVQIA